MKKTCLLLALPGLLAVQSAMAQTYAHLKLSAAQPAAGKPIMLTYDPAGTALAGKPDVQGLVYYLDNKDYPVGDLAFKKVGKTYQANTVVPVTAKAFFVKLYNGDVVDNNDGQGYIYAIYNQQKPVAGADAAKAYVLFSGMGSALAQINNDPDKALALYQSEFARYPQSAEEYQNYYGSLLAGSKKPEVQANALTQATKLAASGNEKNMLLAESMLRRMRKTAQADSLNAIIRKKYPQGTIAKNEMGMAFNKEKDPVKKEELYNAYIKNYPEDLKEVKTVQDNYRLQLANAYLQAGQLEGYHKWAVQVRDQSNLPMYLNNAAFNWAKKGERLADAEKLSKESLNLTQHKIDHPAASSYTSLGMAKKYAQDNYDMYADTYAYILLKENKAAEALKYEQPVYERSKHLDADINENYAFMLAANGQHAKAMQVIEESLKAGKTTAAMQEELKKDYIKVKGSDKGYDTYLASLQNTMQDKQRADLMKEMINQVAPQFALKDFSGNTVSLASLKGKVVVVDFWATWCGPCKASFPGMQMAVNKYKDNSDVKFVFIDTWENGDNYQDGVKKFIADNKYTFHVLMDEKGEDGRQSKVVSQFKVDGIPTKFVIDQNGNIRFKKVGFSGTAEGVMGEVSAMIDLLQKPQGMATAKAEE